MIKPIRNMLRVVCHVPHLEPGVGMELLRVESDNDGGYVGCTSPSGQTDNGQRKWNVDHWTLLSWWLWCYERVQRSPLSWPSNDVHTADRAGSTIVVGHHVWTMNWQKHANYYSGLLVGEEVITSIHCLLFLIWGCPVRGFVDIQFINFPFFLIANLHWPTKWALVRH